MSKLSAGLVPILLSAVLVMMWISLFNGYVEIPVWDVLSALIGWADRQTELIVVQVRLPRALLGAVIGFSLGLSGAALQGLLRNPLAEPAMLGVSSCAGLGAVVVIYFGLAQLSVLLLPVAGIVGAFVAVGLLFLLAGSGAGMLTVILSGVAINGMAIALTSLAMNMAPTPWAVTEMLFWLMGSLRDRSLADLWIALPFMVGGWGLLLVCGRALDALILGEDTARSLGVDLRRTQLLLIGGTALCVGAGTSVAGSIAFVGLVVPHLLRPLVGHRPSRLLWISGLGGAALTMAADLAVRSIDTNPEMNLGVLTSLIGAPFFLYLILKTRRTLQ